MRNGKYYLYLLVICLLVSACNGFGQSATTLPTMAKPTGFSTRLPKPTLEPVSAEWIKNSSFTLPVLGKQVQLINGSYHGTVSGAMNLSVSVLDPIVLGDLNGDEAVDAAVLLAEAGSGSGIVVSLIIMINQDGKLVQSGSKVVDNQPIIHDMTLEDNQIILETTIHATQDAECCPTFDVIQTYQWKNNSITLMRITSKTSSGDKRAITLNTPVAGQQFTGSVVVNGTLSVTPNENKIIYRIYNDQGNGITEGFVAVNSAGIGKPGTFEEVIDLSKFTTGQVIRLAIIELGSDDSLIKVMDSVFIVVSSP